jgi:hypothetical protein
MPGTDRWIVISGSMSMHARMHAEQQDLQLSGVPAVLPPADDHIMAGLGEEEYQAAKRRAALAHFRKVMDPRTFGVLAVNGDKHGIRDYIGPNTFAELAIAFVQGKRIYLLQDVPVNLADELRAWGAIPLRGDLGRLIRDFHTENVGEEAAKTATG